MELYYHLRLDIEDHSVHNTDMVKHFIDRLVIFYIFSIL